MKIIVKNKNKLIGCGIDTTLFKKFYCELVRETNISELNNFLFKKIPNFLLN